jgi:C4-type Zn-finger protein
MSMEIRLSQFVIRSDDATISCPWLELSPGETL